ncbi:magnesium transporter NIPA-domain-containing protein [Russula dissimulans]|nr:magnesium transporter NIPA-domain-containing protein [Russula dissimulans]
MLGSRGIGDIEFPSISRTMVAGISFAIAGNILISFALNLQKLAHARLDKARAERGHRLEAIQEEGCASQGDEESEVDVQPGLSLPIELEREARVWNRTSSETSLPPRLETDPLITLSVTASTVPPLVPTYGALFPSTDNGHVDRSNGSPLRWQPGNAKRPGAALAGEYANRPVHYPSHSPNQESEYLKSKLWWLGFLLMNVGETGNFISYAFAPASVVAPLGTFALVANCLFAPLLLHERLRTRDLFGVVLAMMGAITVVLSVNPSDTRLSPEKLLEAASQTAFLIFSAIYVASASILTGLSEGSIGRRWVLVDVGLCALFGGFTVLSTKAVSTLLAINGFNMFRLWVTYPVLAVLIGTGVGQIRYLNRALMRFDSKASIPTDALQVVIPTQFVLFNLSAIIGSAILYGDFKKAKFHQFMTFMYGCGATFTGVWIIAWVKESPTPTESNDRGAISDIDAESRDPFVSDDGPAGAGVGRKSVSSPVLESRRNKVSLVGISPAQV